MCYDVIVLRVYVQSRATGIMTKGYTKQGYDRPNDTQVKWPKDRKNQNYHAVKDRS